MTSLPLNNLELPATDLDAAKQFYEEHFGWSFIDYGPTYAASRSPGIEVGLSTTATVGTAQAAGDEDGTGPLPLFQADDIDAVHEAMQGDGGVIVTAPFGFPGGRRFHFRDPSGNVLGVYEVEDAE